MTLDDFLEGVDVGKANVLTVAERVLTDGTTAKEVILGQRVLQGEPPALKPLQRSPRRSHVFQDVDAFGAYLAKFGSVSDCSVLADVTGQTISAVLDEHSATGYECVEFVPELHPAFVPWKQVIGRQFSVVDFAGFVAQNRRAVKSARAPGGEQFDGRELALTLSQVTAKSVIKMAAGVGAKSINGVMVETEIKGQRREMPVELPDCITIEAPIFIGTDPVEIEFDLLILGKADDGVYAVLTSTQLQEAFVAAMSCFVGQLKEILPNLVVGLGKLHYTNWETLGG
jgi:hypothetical protein